MICPRSCSRLTLMDSGSRRHREATALQDKRPADRSHFADNAGRTRGDDDEYFMPRRPRKERKVTTTITGDGDPSFAVLEEFRHRRRSLPRRV
ncbi:hypothetical protein LSAT2_007915 [Lamellibrachia satsuma]|nr:hypothetical protein LSAT2_007915 [Lamellibrachia satsuma]